MKRREFVWLSLVWVGLLLVSPSFAAEPAVTPEQIEADWLLQDLLRNDPAANQLVGKSVLPEEDAIGALDGVKNGSWGFHTEHEPDPLWQVDLGEPVTLGRMLLFNRCDAPSRAAEVKVLLSDDGKTFEQVYQHDGTSFLGHSDGKPLQVELNGAKARYLRLQLPGTEYFHLDEVEIYPVGSQQNIGLGKSATQSSTSTWSVKHSKMNALKQFATGQVIQRGEKLAENLQQMGTDVRAEVDVLGRVRRQWQELPPDAPEDVQKELYLQARWAVRKMTRKNPLYDFDQILFAKRIPPAFPHMSDQYYGWWSRGGGGIYVLEGFKSDSPTVRCLTEDMPQGSFLRPDISYDGKKVIFAYCRFYPHVHGVGDKVKREELPEDVFYQLYEMNVDGTGRRQLTRGRYDDFDARYLPNGRIVFLSTRKCQALQCNLESGMATMDKQLPFSYVRCGGGNRRPCPVFTLHTMDADGEEIRPISAFETFEWTPAVAFDGRIIYARWDYIDRFNGPFMSLWSTNADGTNPQLVYGNFTKIPQCVFEARPIPGSTKLVFTAAAHHSNMGGSLALLDRTQGTEFERPITRLTPEVCFPETDGWPAHYYANPYPLSEEHFLTTWSDKGLPGHTYINDADRNPTNSMGIYTYDAFGNQELIYRDPTISSMYPLPIRSRPKEPSYPDTVTFSSLETGRFLVQDVYQGLDGIQRGTVKRLRVIGAPPKVQPHMNNPVLGVSAEDLGKFVLGTVPVEEDGSAHFHVPSGMSVFFQALDEQGFSLQTMRSLTYVQPNQTLTCIGCHEHRDTAPMGNQFPLAAAREPSKLKLDPSGSWPLRFDELVQPVLDTHCVSCHRPDGDDAKAVAFDLSAAFAYQNLLAYSGNDLKNLAFERDRSTVGDMPARHSKLLALINSGEGHEGVQLDQQSLMRLIVWMDTYANIQGSFSAKQEEELRELRQHLAPILTE